MKKIFVFLTGLFLTSSLAFAGPPITLTDGGGNDFGTPSNPIVVTTSSAISTSQDITTTGNITTGAIVSGLKVYGQDNATKSAVRVLSNTSVDRVWIEGDGKVGVGTTKPITNLDVSGITSGVSIGASVMPATTLLRVGTDPKQGLTVKQSGNVGIATTAPAYNLHIVASGTGAGQGIYFAPSVVNDTVPIIMRGAGTDACYQLFINSTGDWNKRSMVCP